MENLPLSENELENAQGSPVHHRGTLCRKEKRVFCVAGAVVFLIIFYFLFFSAPKNFPAGAIMNIKEGSSLRSISKDLKTDNIIRSRVAFETFAIIFGDEKYIAAGDYFFESKLPVFLVARRVSKGERHLAPVKATIPEGFNVSEIAELFALKLPNFSQDKFLLEGKAKEGYLFPDTYFFLTGDNEAVVLRSMSDNFEKKIMPLKPEIIASGKTEKEIIIMASLIEEESKGDIDRGFISGILWKRLAKSIPLQVDAEPSTYKAKGLPPNPISNPGLKAILAAIHPQSSPYLYYLHDKEGNIHYARTFEEHKLNKQKYLN